MNRYEVYKPSRLIQDFYTAPAYYQAKDISWSPHTSVGKLAESHDLPEQTAPSGTIQQFNRPAARVSVFPTGFSLRSIEQVPIVNRSITYTPDLSTGTVTDPDWLWRRNLSLQHAISDITFVPKKYVLGKGVVADFSGRVFTFAKLSSAAMVALLIVIWGIFHTPFKTAQPIPVPANTTKPTVTKNTASHIAAVTVAAPQTTNTVKPRIVYKPWNQSYGVSASPAVVPTSTIPSSTSTGTSPTTTTTGGSSDGSTTTTGNTTSGSSDGGSQGTTTTGSTSGGTSGSGDGDGSTGSSSTGTTGSSGSGSSEGSGDGSDPTTTTVTVPGTSVSIGDQTIVSTDPVTTSL